MPIDTNRASIDRSLLTERRQIAREGVVIPVLTVDASGTLVGRPEIVTRGFHSNGTSLSAIRDRVVDSLAGSSNEERADLDLLEQRIRTELIRFLRRQGRCRPLICPIIREQTP